MLLKKFIPVLCILLGLLVTVKGENKTCNCGRWNPKRIVNGVDTLDHEYPMMAGIVYLPEKVIYCGASIITVKHVLTAAHCFKKYNDPKQLGVCIGVDNVDEIKGKEVDNKMLFQVEKFTNHPNYKEASNNYDISVVTIEQQMRYLMSIAPICIPFTSDRTKFEDKYLRVLGWGFMKPYGIERSKELLRLDTTTIPTEKCREIDNNLDLNNVVCTITGRSGSCKHDGGGPAMWFNTTAHRWVLVGIISLEGCGVKPSVNTRVQNFVNFIINSTTGHNLCNIYY